MTEDKKELTHEEQVQLNVKKTLEDKFIQSVVGSNTIKSNPLMYGQLGLQGGDITYDKAMFSEDANKLRQTIYSAKKAQGRGLGVFGDPSYPSNYDVSMQLAQQVNEVMQLGKLADLETQVKAVAKGFEFSVPAELKNYSVNDLMAKVQSGGTLDDNEKNALGAQGLLQEAYTRALALSAMQSNYFADLNADAKKIADVYKPKEDPNAKGDGKPKK
jgi:hypothetical protein